MTRTHPVVAEHKDLNVLWNTIRAVERLMEARAGPPKLRHQTTKPFTGCGHDDGPWEGLSSYNLEPSLSEGPQWSSWSMVWLVEGTPKTSSHCPATTTHLAGRGLFDDGLVIL